MDGVTWFKKNLASEGAALEEETAEEEEVYGDA
jgi:hypothetical protein